MEPFAQDFEANRCNDIKALTAFDNRCYDCSLATSSAVHKRLIYPSNTESIFAVYTSLIDGSPAIFKPRRETTPQDIKILIHKAFPATHILAVGNRLRDDDSRCSCCRSLMERHQHTSTLRSIRPTKFTPKFVKTLHAHLPPTYVMVSSASIIVGSLKIRYAHSAQWVDCHGERSFGTEQPKHCFAA